MRKSTFIGMFVLCAYFLLFIGIAFGLPISFSSSILLIVMNLIAFWLTLPPEYWQWNSMKRMLRGLLSGRGFRISGYPAMHPSSGMMVMGAVSTFAMAAIVLLIHFLITPLPDIGFSIVVCVLLGMLTIRMQIASEMEGEGAAGRLA